MSSLSNSVFSPFTQFDPTLQILRDALLKSPKDVDLSRRIAAQGQQVQRLFVQKGSQELTIDSSLNSLLDGLVRSMQQVAEVEKFVNYIQNFQNHILQSKIK